MKLEKIDYALTICKVASELDVDYSNKHQYFTVM